MNEIAAEKRRPGRPSKPKDEAPSEPKRYKMKAKPNWDDVTDESFIEESPDRLRISKELIPEGMDMLWVTESVYGQPQPQHRADFEKRGWTPVHQDDFDGQFDGMWMPKGALGEIKVEGLVLMARPLELSIRAKRIDRQKALAQVQIKEAALRGGDLPGVPLDAQHPTAVGSNRINKSIERIAIPEDN